jgi:TatA/E family protein of Tat protein translocase
MATGERSLVMTGLLQGYDLFIVLALFSLLFGASQLPKLARALGSASHEFKRGAEEGAAAPTATNESAADPGGASAPDVASGPAVAPQEIGENGTVR